MSDPLTDDDRSPRPLPGGIGRYKLACRSCPVPEVLAFTSPAERGRWASEHTRETGHDRWLVRDYGEIGISFTAECSDCRDFLKLTDAARVLGDRQPPGGDAASAWLRGLAMAIVTHGGMPGEPAELAELVAAGCGSPKRFITAAERDQWAGNHSLSTGHAIETRVEFH